ncbi:MAG: hypothetical protein AAB873_02635 [Patescibacteria group bacterium]
MQSILQKKSFILALLFFLVSLTILFVLLSVIKGSEVKYKLAEEKWQIENAKREDMGTLKNLLKEVDKEKSLLDSHFIQNPDVVPFLTTVENLAKKVNLQIEVASVNVNEKEPALLVGVKTSGSFGNIYRFITLLENSAYDLVFVSADMKTIEDGLVNRVSKLPEWVATFEIKLLSFMK